MNKRPIAGLFLVLGWIILLAATGCPQGGSSTKDSEGRSEKPAVAVEITPVRANNLIEGIEVTGTLTPKFETAVKAEVAGLVREVFVNDWVPVKKGAPLARIDTLEYEAAARRAGAAVESARATLLEAEVAANRAVREEARMVQLKEAGLATQQGLDEAHTQAAAARARSKAAESQIRVAEEDQRQAEIRLGKGFVRSPIDGVVSQRNVNVGDLAGDPMAGKPLFHIVNNRILNLVAPVPSSALPRLRVGQTMEFITDAIPGRIFSGVVQFVNPAVNEADRSVRVVLEVKNPAGQLKGGLFIKGRIVTGIRKGVLQIPRQALTAWDMTAGKATVFVTAGDRVKERSVQTGVLDGRNVEILSGLSEGESVVVRGGFAVRDGDRITAEQGKGS
jgi:membrane fusion protein (multidrug efflux system)